MTTVDLQKYFTVFQLSLQDEFTYRANFILWRVRNFLRFLMIFFLWAGLFSVNQNAFNFSHGQINSYIFLVLIIDSLVLNSTVNDDDIASDISSGDLSNYLVKPAGYLKRRFARELASKSLNIFFAFFEIAIVWLILRPEISLTLNLISIFGFILSAICAVTIYFLLSTLARLFAFWMPENVWGLVFLLQVVIQVLAGEVAPLSIFPDWIVNLIKLTPFPYLIYFPISILTGKIVGLEVPVILFQSLIWVLILYFAVKYLWAKGIIVYQASGR